MAGKLADLVSAGAVAQWLLIAFLVGYFIYKEWPEFRRRMSHGAVKDVTDEMTGKSVQERLISIEREVKQVNEKLDRDYKRINSIEIQMDRTKKVQADTSEELEIIMRALLGVLKGLQEEGSNVTLKDAEEEIQNYLNRKAHKGDPQ